MTELAAHQREGIAAFFATVGPRLQAADRLLGQDPGHAQTKARQEWANAVFEAWSWPGYLFAWSMGAGKTLAALTILDAWPTFVGGLNLGAVSETALLRPALIAGPAANRFVWEEQAARHGITVAAYTAETDADFQAALPLLGAGAVAALVSSYTGLARNQPVLAGLGFGLGIFDEVQKMGNTTTQLSQAIYRLSQMGAQAVPGIPVRLALSGTPFMNHIEQLWPVLAYLNGFPLKRQRKAGQTYYILRSSGNLWFEQSEFERAYTHAEFNRWGGKKLTGRNLYHDPVRNPDCRRHRAADCNCLHERMLRLNTHRVTAEVAEANIPESPPPQWVPIPLAFWQRKLYQHIVERAELPLSGENPGTRAIARAALITYAFEAAASTEQLRASLQARDSKLDLAIDSYPVQPESSKLDQIVEMVGEMDAPVIVATGFARFAEQIAGDPRLGQYKPLLLAGTGNLSAGEFQSKMWSGNHRVGVVTTMGATGLNLQCAPYVIVAGFYDWSALQVLQLIARAKRQGQTRRVVSYILYDPATIEGWLRGKLKAKIENSAAVLDGRSDGAEDLGLGSMSHGDFAGIFYGEARSRKLST